MPAAGSDLSGSVGQWRTWLAGHGLGLVQVADASTFAWPGYWVAVLDPAEGARQSLAVLMFGTPSGVVLSPQEPALLGRAARDLSVQAGYVVAALDPVAPRAAAPARDRGVVEVVAIAPRAEAPMQRVPAARAVPGRGLEGDRYADGAGTFSPRKANGVGYDLTLVEAEVLDTLVLPDGTHLEYAEARRNIVTRGIDLNALVGRRFEVGGVECVGRRLCEPCSHLERLTRPGALRGLIHKGGLRADVVGEGTIEVGAAVRPL
jgi:MOSC domain-containing protein YiiM